MSLKTANLSSQQITDEMLKEHLANLQHHPDLEEINLNDNEITEEGAGYLANFLKMSSLRILKLSNNCIHARGLRKIAEAMDENTTLVELHISNNLIKYNHDMKKNMEGVETLFNNLQKNDTLLNLNISHNMLGNKLFSNLIHLVSKKNNKLQVINASTNCIQDKGTLILCQALEEKEMQTQIWLHGNLLTPARIELLTNLSNGIILGFDTEKPPLVVGYVGQRLKNSFNLIIEKISVKNRYYP